MSERLPRNYLTILDAVASAPRGEHLTAHEVFVRARTAQPKIGFATVHRALARLGELGHVHKVDVPGAASAVYERMAEPHAHFRCTRCGRIQDVAFSVPHEMLTALAAQHQLEIAAESTTFAGCCAHCAH
jgi:Fe2+ or Zn2+ uptake regulation protein